MLTSPIKSNSPTNKLIQSNNSSGVESQNFAQYYMSYNQESKQSAPHLVHQNGSDGRNEHGKKGAGGKDMRPGAADAG